LARLEPRILLEDPKKSYDAKQRVSDKDIFDIRRQPARAQGAGAEFAGKVHLRRSLRCR